MTVTDAGGAAPISASTSSFSVALQSTSLSLSSSSNPSVYGQSVTFTAVVSNDAGTPTGSVTFSDANGVLGTVPLSVVNGVDQAAFTSSTLAFGSTTITASYSGDSTYESSSSSLSQTVFALSAIATKDELVSAINYTNNAGSPTTMTLVPGTTFDFTTANNFTNGANALPVITANITIVGNGDTIKRDSGVFRLFDVSSGGSLNLQNLTLSGGLARGMGAAAKGGAIYSSGTLNLNGVTVKSNSAQGSNGGYGGGQGVSAFGGGLYIVSGSVTLTNDTLSGNYAQGGGGGFGFYGRTGGTGGTGGNGIGGGLYSAASGVTLTNDTLSGNYAQGGFGGYGGGGAYFGGAGGFGGNGMGGGLYSAAPGVTLTNDTLSGNYAQGGRGGYGGYGFYFGQGAAAAGGNGMGGGLFSSISSHPTLANTLIAENSGGDVDASGAIASSDHDLIGDGSGFSATTSTGDIIGTSADPINPLLGSLQNNGGPTQTMALLPGSPALGSGDPNAPGLPSTDQRGLPRIVAGKIDIGALQTQLAPTTMTLSTSSSPSVYGQYVTFTAIVSSISPGTPTGTVTFSDANGNLGSSALSLVDGVDEAAINISTLAAGSYTITASYSGDPFYKSNDAAVSQQVNAVTSSNLQTVLSSTSSVGFAVSDNTDLQTLLSAINGLSAPPSPVYITINLGVGTYSDVVVNPPTGVTLIINGVAGSTTIVGHSPALTVLSGDVEVENGITLTTATNAPTILIQGGSLTLNGDTIDSSTGYNQAALQVTGGSLALGSTNTIDVNGAGQFLQAASFNGITEQADVLEHNGKLIPGSLLSLTSLSSSSANDTSVYGQSIALTATVSTVDSDKPTGSVDFFDATTNQDLGSASVVVAADGSYQAVLTTSVLTAESHNIIATYSGDGTYGFSSGSLNQVVKQLAVTLGGSRTYDGTTTAVYNILSITNVVGSDNVTLSGSATLASANAGNEQISSFAGLSLGGSSVGNYTLTGATGSVNITQAPLTISAVSANKTYDGTTSSTAAPKVSGLQGSDTVSGLSESYDSANAGSRTLSVNNGYFINDGNNGNNYTVTLQTASGTIYKATTTFGNLTVTQITVGTASTTVLGQLTSNTIVPVGQNVSITLNSVTQSATVTTNGDFSTSFTTSGLDVGAYTISYSYAGDNNFTAKTGTGSLTVGYGTKLLFDNTKPVHSGAALPIKLALTNASGADISSSNIAVTGVSLVGPNGNAVPLKGEGNSNPNNVFRYDASLGGYSFNLDSKGLAAGTYTFYYKAGNDPTLHSLTFVVG